MAGLSTGDWIQGQSSDALIFGWAGVEIRYGSSKGVEACSFAML